MGDRRELKITIEFYSDGHTVANMWKHRPGGGLIGALHLKHGEAKCHPDDKFDPQIGAMIAMARMFGDEVEFHANEEKPRKKPKRKLTDAEKKALDEGYTLCRDRYPNKPGWYDVTTEDGAFWGDLWWNGSNFGNTPDLWMNKRHNPAIAWKEHK